MGRLQIFDPSGGLSVQNMKNRNSAFMTITPVMNSNNKVWYDEMTHPGSDDAGFDIDDPFGNTVASSFKAVAGFNMIGRGNGSSALYANMPITGVNITQGVDMSIAKTLNADFVVSEFGDSPVQISLSGINFYGNISCNGIGLLQNKQVMDFYEANKLSTDIGNRLDISITPAASPRSGTFRCILVKMKSTTPISQQQAVTPAYSYEMSLIGVRR